MTEEATTVSEIGEATQLSQETLESVPLEQLGTVLCRSEGFSPDQAFWEIGGVPHDWQGGVVNDATVRNLIMALMFRKGGTFELVYQTSALALDSHGHATQDWDPYRRASCMVTPAAAFELQQWFAACQKVVDRKLLLKQRMLDDEGVAAARKDLLAANRLDPETIAFERAARLVAVGLTDTAIAQQRQQVVAAALAAAGLDDASVAKLREKAFEEVTLDDDHVKRAIPRLYQRERLDDSSIALARELLLKEHGLL